MWSDPAKDEQVVVEPHTLGVESLSCGLVQFCRVSPTSRLPPLAGNTCAPVLISGGLVEDLGDNSTRMDIGLYFSTQHFY